MAIRQGMRRLILVLWALGALLLVILPAEPLFSPSENVCVSRPGPPYPECYSKEARELEEIIAGANHEADKALAMLDDDYQKIDTSKDVRRLDTERYRFALKFLAGIELAWTASYGALFYLVGWVVSGFRNRA